MMTESAPEPRSPEQRIVELAGERALAHGLELVDIECLPRGRFLRVAIAVDRPGGVSVGECAELNRDLSSLLQEDARLAGAVGEIEVGSPGLTRPLKGARDFERFQGRLALLTLSSAVAGRKQWRGRLMGYDAGSDTIRLDSGGQTLDIPLGSVARARLDFDFSDSGRTQERELKRL